MTPAALVILALAAFPAPAPDSLDLRTPGLMSAPTRLLIDLDKGAVWCGKGKGPGPAAGEIRVTAQAAFPPATVQRLRALADTALAKDFEIQPPRPPAPDSGLFVKAANHGARFEGAVFWPTPEARALIDAAYAARPAACG